MRWVLAMPDGTIQEGEDRPSHFGDLCRASDGGAFIHPCGGILFVASGPDMLWTTHTPIGHGKAVVFWGFALPPGARLWWSSQGVLGIGDSVEAVERIAVRLGDRVRTARDRPAAPKATRK